MKKLIVILSVFSAFLLAPTGAFAKDKHKKHKHCDDDKQASLYEKQARLEADRRANGYYSPRYNARYRGYSRNTQPWLERDSRDHRRLSASHRDLWWLY
jgi:hypothetical protein